MKAKTSELTGPALDWAVEHALGRHNEQPNTCFECPHHEERHGRDDPIYYCHHPKSVHEQDDRHTWADVVGPYYGVHPRCPISALTPLPFSTNWSQGGPIIEREKIELSFDGAEGGVWAANFPAGLREEFFEIGPTPLIAAMRCFVASKLGDEVDVPEELLP